MHIDAYYYDGRSSQRHAVRLQLTETELIVVGDGFETTCPIDDLTLTAPLGSLRRALYLDNGAKCEFSDRAFALQLSRRQGKRSFFSRLHRWESSLKLAVLALVLTVVLVAGFIRYGLPVLAEQAAYAVPPATEESLGEETLKFLDRALLAPTELDPERQQQLEQGFARVVGQLDSSERTYQLKLRRSPRVGANAFALPGGTIIMTDELVQMAGRQEEIDAVLAHEVGHIRHRHAMRQVIQDSSVALLIATLTGDVFSATSMAAALPAMLVDASYSRDMEREADDVAVEYLRSQSLSSDHFATILNRLEAAHAEKHGAKNGSQQPDILDYFSSHPAVEERLARLKKDAPQ